MESPPPPSSSAPVRWQQRIRFFLAIDNGNTEELHGQTHSGSKHEGRTHFRTWNSVAPGERPGAALRRRGRRLAVARRVWESGAAVAWGMAGCFWGWGMVGWITSGVVVDWWTLLGHISGSVALRTLLNPPPGPAYKGSRNGPQGLSINCQHRILD